MRKAWLPVIILITSLGCKEETVISLREGVWKAELEVMDNERLPFIFELSRDSSNYVMQVKNAEEVVSIDEIAIQGDSIRIQMPVFEGYIAGTYSGNIIEGEFIKESLDRVVPFKAHYGESERFYTTELPKANLSGIWETVFDTDGEDPYVAKGIFTQNGINVKGTFRTTTGDYRYLEGILDGDTLRLSTFDGAHAFLFKAGVTDSTLNGYFYSGNHSKELFTAVKNEVYELPDEDSLTFIKEGYDGFSFSFPDAEGNIRSSEDPDFRDKVLVVQIMGTWCPNCLDESKFLVKYLEEHPNPELQVVALAFEYAKTQEKAFQGIARLKNRLGITYPILLAQYGTSNKMKANEKLPMLNHVLSYPTTIFIGKNGEVRKITTGFNGPATGDKFLEFKEEFELFLNDLLAEQPDPK